jgi:hypothetical protein
LRTCQNRQVQGERTHPDIGLLTTGFNRSVADLFRLARFWLCRSGISKISILKDIYLENRFIYNQLEAILFEGMRKIDLLWEIVKYTASFL